MEDAGESREMFIKQLVGAFMKNDDILRLKTTLVSFGTFRFTTLDARFCDAGIQGKINAIALFPLPFLLVIAMNAAGAGRDHLMFC